MPTIPFEEVAQFHGHVCPGLAIGYRMTLTALASLSEHKAQDEELVAIVENDACGVDALQYLSGCTFGKGNLIFRDYGKSVCTLYSRRTGTGVRVVWKDPHVPDELSEDRMGRIGWILKAPEDQLVSVQIVHIDAPPMARIHESTRCDACGERVMGTRIHRVGNQNLCIPCRDKRSD